MQIKTETKVGFFVLLSLGVFGYMAMYINGLQWHFRNYVPYTIYFPDVAGLIRKADVKIAGVKVGWVDSIRLVDRGERAEVRVMINNKYVLHDDAYGTIHQDGLLGAKYVEMVPGSPGRPTVVGASVLNKPGRSPANLNDVMLRFDTIAKNIEEVSASLKGALGGQNKKQFKELVDNLSRFVRVLSEKSESVGTVVDNLATFSQDLAPLAKRIDDEVLPAFQRNIEKISNVFDRDFGKVAQRIDKSFDSIQSIVEKIDKGEGALGKLIGEKDVYEDVKTVTKGFCDAAETASKMMLTFDSHFESMGRPTSGYDHRDSKGYFGLKLRTSQDWFYLFQIVQSERGGVVEREEVTHTYFDSQGNEISDATLSKFDSSYSVFPPKAVSEKVRRNLPRFSYQVGKSFNRIGLRAGVFEGFFGLAADYELPFTTDSVRWVTSFEAFDFNGQNRVNDRRPHLKWLNKVYFLRNLYFTFGADDFVSKKNANPFFGLGLQFGDDDVKYLAGKVGLPKID